MKYYGGIDLGGTNTKIGLLDEKGTLIFKANIKTTSEEGYKTTIKRICDVMLHEIEVANIELSDIVAIGVGIPGPVVKNKIVKFFANFNWDKNLNLAKEFEGIIGKPVYVGNDVNVITLGETWVGAAKGYSDILGLAIGTGIGAGVIVDNKLVSGKVGAGGEVGHIKLIPNGLLCGCGQKGCFEAYASATGIIREAESRLKVNKNNLLYEIVKDRSVEAKDVFDAAKQGDKFSMDIVEYITDMLALGISNVLNILDPQIVVIGGGVALAGEILFDKIKKKIKNYTMPPILEGLEIKPAILGNDAGIYGAAYLAMLEEK